MQIKSVVFKNYSGTLVDIDVDIHNGFPGFDIYLNSSTTKGRAMADRLRVSIRNQGFKFPKGSVITSVKPDVLLNSYDVLDLPVALSLLLYKITKDVQVLCLGSLNFEGRLCSSNYDISSLVKFAKSKNVKNIIIPFKENSRTSYEFSGIHIYTAKDLKQAADICINIANGSVDIAEIGQQATKISDGVQQNKNKSNPFKGIIGLDFAKRALIIAVAGGHNLLFVGPRGSGKSLLLSRAERLCQTFNKELESVREQNRQIVLQNNENFDYAEANIIHLDNYNISKYLTSALGKVPPISLYHGGFVRVDEIADVDYKYLQLLKDILDRGYITADGDKLPLRLSLLASMNPCPCGNLGLSNGVCRCQTTTVEKHWRALTNSLLSRFELRVPVSGANYLKDIIKDYSNISDQIKTAYQMQYERYKRTRFVLNGDIVHYGLDSEELHKAIQLFPDFSNIRDCLCVYSVARTIADLQGKEGLTSEHAELARAFWQNNPESIFR